MHVERFEIKFFHRWRYSVSETQNTPRTSPYFMRMALLECFASQNTRTAPHAQNKGKLRAYFGSSLKS